MGVKRIRALLLGLTLAFPSLMVNADCELMSFEFLGSKQIEHQVVKGKKTIRLDHSSESSVIVSTSDIREIVDSNMFETKTHMVESKEMLLAGLDRQKENSDIEFDAFLASLEGYHSASELVRSHVYVGLLRAIEWAIYQGDSFALVDGHVVDKSRMKLYQRDDDPKIRKLIYQSDNVVLYEICGHI